MIAKLIAWSADHRALVFAIALLLALLGAFSARRAPLDAIPDLSDTQVILFTPWMGRSPDLVEDQVTWPLSRALLSTPHAKAVRGRSMFGMSFVHVLFEDGTIPEDARLGVTEILSRVTDELPEGVRPSLGPDASGVGWVYQYALVDDSGELGPTQLRQIQETLVKPTLQATPGVAEIATLGGYVDQIEVSLDPARMLAHGVSFSQVADAVVRANRPAGGGSIDVAEHAMMVRLRAEVQSLDDLLDAPIPGAQGIPRTRPEGASGTRLGADNAMFADPLTSPTHIVRVRDVASVQHAPASRLGVADFDGLGETAGGIVIARQGTNALDVIEAVKTKITALSSALPPGVRLVQTYDRSSLIRGAVQTLRETLVEELVVVSLIILLFLGHFRTALIPIFILPVAVLASFIPMFAQDITISIMSLSGIAVAVGAMVDSAILTVENIHVHLARWEAEGSKGSRRDVLVHAMQEVGPSAFFSLLVIGVSFIPVFALEGAEGRLFGPLAWTKTWSMLFAAVGAVTVAPALAVTLIHTRGKTEEEDRISAFLTAIYTPIVRGVVRHKRFVVGLAALLLLASLPVLRHLSWEFMPPLHEGSVLYMPAAPPGISEQEASRLLQRIDQQIKSVPEVASVHGKMGRAETATDPAPLSMAEVIVEFKPQQEWRPGLTRDALITELDAKLQIPGFPNLWWGPVQTRVEMLSTGIRSPLGLRVEAPTVEAAQEASLKLERVLADIPGTQSLFADRSTGAFTLDVHLRRADAAAFGVSAADVAETLEGAFEGLRAGEWIDGRTRLPIVVRYARDFRTDPTALSAAIVQSSAGPLTLSQVADVTPSLAPSMIASEDGRIVNDLFVNPGERTPKDWMAEAEARLVHAGFADGGLGPNVNYRWVGTFQALDRAVERLSWMVPLVLLIIMGLLRHNTGSWTATAIVLLSLPVSVAGAAWFLWMLDYHMSVAVLVGLIALAGVDAETGVVMLLYLRLAWDKHKEGGEPTTAQTLENVIVEGAARRLRPKLMTVATDIIGFIPVFLVAGIGSDIMRRIAAPMIGGLTASFATELIVYPALFAIWRWRDVEREA